MISFLMSVVLRGESGKFFVGELARPDENLARSHSWLYSALGYHFLLEIFSYIKLTGMWDIEVCRIHWGKTIIYRKVICVCQSNIYKVKIFSNKIYSEYMWKIYLIEL